MSAKKLLLPFLFLAVLLFQQCGTDAFQKDLLNYINVELPKVASLESEALGAYSSVVGSNYTTDSAMYMKITETVIPKYQQFTGQLEAITPATDELKKVHAEYITAAKEQLKAFNLITDALLKQDANEIKEANAELSKAVTQIESWKTDLLDMCKKHNIVIEK